jgi:hypothetical protein
MIGFYLVGGINIMLQKIETILIAKKEGGLQINEEKSK